MADTQTNLAWETLLNLLRMAGDPDDTRLMVGYGNLADAQVTAGVAALVELIREAGGEG